VLRRAVAGQLFQRVVSEAAAAGGAGAFDEPDSHLNRMLVELDDQGWHAVSELLTDALRRIQAIQIESDARREEGADARVSEIVLMHFEIEESLASTGSDGERAELPKRSPPLP
jgi:hypothetical protein